MCNMSDKGKCEFCGKEAETLEVVKSFLDEVYLLDHFCAVGHRLWMEKVNKQKAEMHKEIEKVVAILAADKLPDYVILDKEQNAVIFNLSANMPGHFVLTVLQILEKYKMDMKKVIVHDSVICWDLAHMLI